MRLWILIFARYSLYNLYFWDFVSYLWQNFPHNYVTIDLMYQIVLIPCAWGLGWAVIATLTSVVSVILFIVGKLGLMELVICISNANIWPDWNLYTLRLDCSSINLPPHPLICLSQTMCWMLLLLFFRLLLLFNSKHSSDGGVLT